MRIVLLDEPGLPRETLCRVLVEAGHDVRACSDLLETRRLCKGFAPQVCLVELVRANGNGFTLAALLQKVTKVTGVVTVLLSDRNLDADRLWANARGIEYVLTRSNGKHALLHEIEQTAATQIASINV